MTASRIATLLGLFLISWTGHTTRASAPSLTIDTLLDKLVSLKSSAFLRFEPIQAWFANPVCHEQTPIKGLTRQCDGTVLVTSGAGGVDQVTYTLLWSGATLAAEEIAFPLVHKDAWNSALERRFGKASRVTPWAIIDEPGTSRIESEWTRTEAPLNVIMNIDLREGRGVISMLLVNQLDAGTRSEGQTDKGPTAGQNAQTQ